MKNCILFFILIISAFSFSQTNKLPIPSNSFLEKVVHESNADEKYFEKYFGKKSERKLKRYSDSKDICSKIIEFSKGIIYKIDSCSETGDEVEITFPNYSKKDVIQFVEWFFKTEDNIWNKTKTKYQPKEDNVAGCYLEIKELKGKIILSYYCGC